jgi:transcriptional regulator with XRE-family HTH domain
VAAGLSQRSLGRITGLSQSRVSRVEAARHPSEWLEGLAVHCAALGLRLSIKVYPSGSPVRDAGHLRLLARFRAQLGDGWQWTSESPIGPFPDLRAWDVRLDGADSVGVDVETRLRDIQALQRRSETKLRDSSVERLVLVVAKTRHNQLVLRDHRQALYSLAPADTRAVMSALRRSELPPRNGIVVL